MIIKRRVPPFCPQQADKVVAAFFIVMRWTIERMKCFAATKGGFCDSEEYLGLKTKLRWRCRRGHCWSARPTNLIHSGQWCPECAGNQRLGLVKMQSVAAQRGGKCISESFKSTVCKMQWECSCGFRWYATPKNILKGRWCPKCSGRLSPCIEDARHLALSRGGVCLSKHVSRTSQTLQWQCKKGHQWHASFNNVKSRQSWCPHCREWKREEECRSIFESIFNCGFPKARRVFGTRLELDGYNSELKIAFEYNGEQHYKTGKLFNTSEEELRKSQTRDRQKLSLCRDNGVLLVVVTYKDAKNLRRCILEQLYNKQRGVVVRFAETDMMTRFL